VVVLIIPGYHGRDGGVAANTTNNPAAEPMQDEGDAEASADEERPVTKL
jgi:hypothetical protein